MAVYIWRIVYIVLMLYSIICTCALFKAFNRMPVKGFDKSSVAYGIINHVAFVIFLAVMLIKG